MAQKDRNDLLTRLDERTEGFKEALADLKKAYADGHKDTLIALKDHAAEDTKRFESHDSRLKILEGWRWYLLGAVAVSGFVLWLLKT